MVELDTLYQNQNNKNIKIGFYRTTDYTNFVSQHSL